MQCSRCQRHVKLARRLPKTDPESLEALASQKPDPVRQQFKVNKSYFTLDCSSEQFNLTLCFGPLMLRSAYTLVVFRFGVRKQTFKCGMQNQTIRTSI